MCALCNNCPLPHTFSLDASVINIQIDKKKHIDSNVSHHRMLSIVKNENYKTLQNCDT